VHCYELLCVSASEENRPAG